MNSTIVSTVKWDMLGKWA